MRLNVILTTGWGYEKPPGLTAKKLHDEACKTQDYKKSLSSQLNQIKPSCRNNIDIYYFEQLFRKRTRGFDDIKKLVGALTEIEDNKNIICHLDAFAYSFLKGAKNFDLLLQFRKEQNETFIATYKKWSQFFRKLEKFERFGQQNYFCKQNISNAQKKQYLKLRKIVSRISARDEIRTLATLLVSGPSTRQEVSDDLGLNYPLGQRTIGVFENIGVVKRESEIYTITTNALPIVIFCLRETIGLDLLSNLDLEGK